MGINWTDIAATCADSIDYVGALSRRRPFKARRRARAIADESINFGRGTYVAIVCDEKIDIPRDHGWLTMRIRGDLAEKLLGDLRGHEVCGGLTTRLQGVALAEGDHFFGDGARGFGTGQRGGDAAVLEQIGDQVAQRGAAMPGIAS